VLLLKGIQMLQGSGVKPAWAILAAALAAAFPARGAKKCDESPCADIACAKARTTCLLDAKKADRAASLLAAEEEKLASERDYHLLLASAYLALDETAGALAALDSWIETHPDDCTVKAWLAWVYMSHELDELARELIADEACAGERDVLALRYDLLGTYLDIKNGEGSAEELDSIEVKDIYEEDIPLHRYAASVLHPLLPPPLMLRFVAKGGYTTNALSGSPKDPTMAHKRKASPLISHEVTFSAQPLFLPWLAGRLDLASRSMIYLFDEEWLLARGERAATADPYDFTSFDFGVRAGVTFLKAHAGVPHLYLGYAGDALFLNMEDMYEDRPPVVFYEGHRAEIEIAIMPSIVLFAGAGRRLFREDVRTRWELDGGVGFQKPVASWLTLLGAASVRGHFAERRYYDLFGSSVLGSAVFNMPLGFQLRTLLALHMDAYRDSLGYFQEDRTRRDTTVRLTAEFLTMSLRGVRFSAVYEFSDKLSSAPDYSFVDHRVMVTLSFTQGFDLLGLKKSAEDHVPLDYGVTGGPSIEGSIQDLLRTDEHVRGGPGCGCTE